MRAAGAVSVLADYLSLIVDAGSGSAGGRREIDGGVRAVTVKETMAITTVRARVTFLRSARIIDTFS